MEFFSYSCNLCIIWKKQRHVKRSNCQQKQLSLPQVLTRNLAAGSVPLSIVTASSILCHLFGCSLYGTRQAIKCIFGDWWWSVQEATKLNKQCKSSPDILENLHNFKVDLYSLHSSATCDFGAVNLRLSIKTMLKFTISTLNLLKYYQSSLSRSFRVFVVA